MKTARRGGIWPGTKSDLKSIDYSFFPEKKTNNSSKYSRYDCTKIIVVIKLKTQIQNSRIAHHNVEWYINRSARRYDKNEV